MQSGELIIEPCASLNYFEHTKQMNKKANVIYIRLFCLKNFIFNSIVYMML